jgi:hypothetical protein
MRQILHDLSDGRFSVLILFHILMPAFNELPMIKVVHPAYHCLPNGGHGSFFPSGNLRLSCDRVFANSAGYVIEISTAPALAPARIERIALAFFFSVGAAAMLTWLKCV